MWRNIFLTIGIFLFCIKSVWAIENNKFGIHLAQPDFENLKAAKELVNSSGGDWGYVTLVIQENDRHPQKWQEIFDQLRKLHLIPIIRLATVPEGDTWRRPKKEDADNWVNFLDSLNWVIKNRYVILFNEPNHGKEWGGAVDAKDYAQVSLELAKKLKEKNSDFFIMLAGLDASAPHQPPKFEDEEIFLRKVFNHITIEQFDNLFSGWSSHSYPNPGFSGSPWDFGRGTVRTYQWELDLLRSLGITKQLPVFITETGWKRKVNSYQLSVNRNNLNEDLIANYFKTAFEQLWLPDERIWAVTPFILDYQTEPFLGFSWKLPSSLATEEQLFYPQYYKVQSLPKVKGEPEQKEAGEISFDLPKELVADSTYHFNLKLKNLGQAIWDKDDGYSLLVIDYLDRETNHLGDGRRQDGNVDFEILFEDLKDIKPFEEKEIRFVIKTSQNTGRQKLKFVLQKGDKKILETPEAGSWQFEILPLPSLKFQVEYWPWGKGEGEFEIQIFDWEERLVYKTRLKAEGGIGYLERIKDITLGDLYRVVILKKNHLPRQLYYIFHSGENKIRFKKLLPFDLNNDGKFSFKDLFWWIGPS